MFTSVTEYVPTIRSVFVELPEDVPPPTGGRVPTSDYYRHDTITSDCIDIYTISRISPTITIRHYGNKTLTTYGIAITTYSNIANTTHFKSKTTMHNCYKWLRDVVVHRSTYEDGTILTYEDE